MSLPPPDAGASLVGFDYFSPYLDGVYLAVNALEDTFLVYDAHNCGYYKAEKIAGNHDLFSTLLRSEPDHRVMRTNIESQQFVMGSDDLLSKKLRQVLVRYRPTLVFVASSSVILFSGHDPEPILRETRERTTVPIVRIPGKHQDRDHIAGYLDATEGVMANLLPRERGGHPRQVLLAGYVYERDEGDHRGNVAELSRLACAAGAEGTTILLDHRPAAAYRQALPPGLVVDLAEGWNAARSYADQVGATYWRAPLPVGIEGTTAWLRSLAERLDAPSRIEAWIAEETETLARELQWLIPRFCLGRHIAVFADRLWLPPLVTFLEALGFVVRLMGCTSRGEGIAAPVVTLAGSKAEGSPQSVRALRERLADLHARRELDLVIGNSFLHQLVSPLGLPCVDFGYPCDYHHALALAPTLGYRGVRTWMERIINVSTRPDEPFRALTETKE